MPRLTDKNELTVVASDDLLHVVDISDTTSSASGTSKKATVANIVLDILNAVISGDCLETTYCISAKKIGTFAYLASPTATTVTIAATYYPIAGTFNNVPAEGFTGVATPALRYDGAHTQYFEVDWHATCKGDSNGITVSFGVNIGGVLEAGSVMSTYLKTSGELYAISGTVVIELAQNDEVQLVLTSDGDGDVITVQNYTTSINEFFD